MRWLTLGRVDEIRKRVASAAIAGNTGCEVLEIGCGTGALSLLLLRAGARVTALDHNPEMLEIARRRIGDNSACRLLERTAAEVDAFDDRSFDAVVAAFSLSEMSATERAFVLERAREKLRPRGRLVIADEVLPRGPLARVLFAIVRIPQAMAGWLLVGSVSHAIPALDAEIVAAGFAPPLRQEWLGGHLAVFVTSPVS